MYQKKGEQMKHTLKQLRHKKNETQEQTSKSLDISRAMYSHYENGIRLPRINVAIKMATYFGVKVDDIIFLNNNDTKRHISNKEITSLGYSRV